MRVSQTLLNNLVMQKTARAQRGLVEASSKLSARSRVMRPSDDPVGASRLRRLQRSEARLSTLGYNRQTVRGDLEGAETLLESIHNQIVRAQELAMQMSNDSMNEADRAAAGREVELMFDQVIGLANRRQSGNNYLFGGLRDDTPALAADGTYLGNDLNRVVEVAPGIEIEATLTGTEAFGDGMSVLQTISSLAEALNDPDNTGEDIGAFLGELNDARNTISLARTEVGTRLSRLDELDELSADLATSIELDKADVEAVDFAAGAAEFAAAQVALNAVIDTSRTMLDYGSGSWLR
ncbi:MAG: flagellar hook-associated protein 3 [Proteobacteria bacterium]|nr:MAG: flagellar hook-associated protein 3 [Pseudomonadota bacterium]